MAASRWSATRPHRSACRADRGGRGQDAPPPSPQRAHTCTEGVVAAVGATRPVSSRSAFRRPARSLRLCWSGRVAAERIDDAMQNANGARRRRCFQTRPGSSRGSFRRGRTPASRPRLRSRRPHPDPAAEPPPADAVPCARHAAGCGRDRDADSEVADDLERSRRVLPATGRSCSTCTAAVARARAFGHFAAAFVREPPLCVTPMSASRMLL